MSYRPLALLLMAEVLAVSTFNLPNEGFTRWAFLDSGADLSIRAMVARGLRPTIDFGYIYGLLPLTLTDLLQSILGSTPTTCRAASLICHLVFAWGLARFAGAMRIGPAGLLLIVFAMPDMLLTSSVVLVHVLEPALLVHALAFQAQGRRSYALALATVCLFVKPTIGYLYGLVLVIDILWIERRNALRSFNRATATGLFLLILMCALFGASPAFRTLLPGNGMAVYRAQHYGFFNEAGRQFWVIPGGGIRDYFRYEVGGWLLGGALLTVAGLVSLVRIALRVGGRRDEMILTCAVLHIVFVLVFFGNRFSWIYYYSILILGIASLNSRRAKCSSDFESEHAARSTPLETPVDQDLGEPGPARSPWPRFGFAIVLGFALVVLIGNKVKLQMSAGLWRINQPTPETYGLWASASQRAEWKEVLELIKGSKPVGLLSDCEGAAVMAPALFLPPDCSYLVEGHTVQPEIERKAERISRASMIVSTRAPNGYRYWPEIAKALRGCRLVRKSGMFWVLRRDRPPG